MAPDAVEPDAVKQNTENSGAAKSADATAGRRYANGPYAGSPYAGRPDADSPAEGSPAGSPASGSSTPAEGMLNLKTGERRIATVLFSDMRGFSRLSERLDPEETDALMSRLFATFESIIKRYGGYVEKYIGDALVAVFGVPKIHDNDPSLAVNSALDFMQEIGRINARFQEGEQKLQFRTGIHTGLVTTGKRGEYDVVTGHALTLAQRIQSSAQINTILVSRSTKEEAEHDFVFSPASTLRIQGVEEKVSVHTVLGRNLSFLKYSTPFVGRDSLLEEMLKEYTGKEGEKFSTFYITGGAGIGKTRIAAQFMEEISRFPRFSSPQLFARSTPFTDAPYDAIIDLILSSLGLTLPVARESVKKAAAIRLAADETMVDRFWDVLNGKVVEKSALRELLTHLLIAAVDGDSLYPPVLLLDNASYLDAAERDFFRLLVERLRDRIFYVLTDRDADQEIANIFPSLRIISVSPFSREETERMIGSLVSGGVEEEFVRDVDLKAGGNPLFIEEMVKYSERWREGEPLPPTIQNVILSSVEKLPVGIREILTKASIFNSPFSCDQILSLQENTGREFGPVESALQTLQSEGLIVREGQRYSFRSETIREVVYSSILNYNKKLLHRLVASRLKEAESSSNSALLHHLVEAEAYDEAMDLIVHGETDFFSLEHVGYIDRILPHVDDKQEDSIFQLLFAKYAILFNNRRMEGLSKILRDILAMALKAQRPGYLAQAYHLCLGYHGENCNPHTAFFYGQKAIHYYKAIKAKRLINNAISLTAEEARKLNRSALSYKLCNQIEDEEHRDHALVEHYCSVEKYPEGFTLLKRMREAREGKDRTDYVSLHLLFQLVRYYHETASFERLTELAQEIENRKAANYGNLAFAYAALAVAYSSLGERGGGLEAVRKAEYFEKQNLAPKYDTRALIVESLIAAGQYARAEEAAKGVLIETMDRGSHCVTFQLLLQLARIHLEQEEPGPARFYLKEFSFYQRSRIFYIPFRQQIWYHYFGYLTEEENQAREACLRKAAVRLEKMMARLAGSEFQKTYLRNPYFEEISRAAIKPKAQG
jgi:class 3 adenylate cyclase